MKIFFAGSASPRGSVEYTTRYETEVVRAAGVRRRLFPFPSTPHEKWKRKMRLFRDLYRDDGELMLDSGAFSAWTGNGEKIDLDAYAAFILEHPTAFTIVVNLDEIPATREPAEVERAARQSWENWEALKRRLAPAGITPTSSPCRLLPVYHRGEPIEWLERMLAETDYVGLGGAGKGVSAERKIEWMDSLMPRLRRPGVKFHGFAVTDLAMLERYPYHTVDSSTWAQGNIHGGKVYLPRGILGLRHRMISADVLVRRLNEGGFDWLQRERIFAYLNRHDITPRMLAEDHCLRCESAAKPCCTEPAWSLAYMVRDWLNLRFFLAFERSLEVVVTGG